MLAFKMQTLLSFLSLKVQAETGLSYEETKEVGGVLKILTAQAFEMEQSGGNVVDIKPLLAQRQANEWCHRQGLRIAEQDPDGGDAA